MKPREKALRAVDLRLANLENRQLFSGTPAPTPTDSQPTEVTSETAEAAPVAQSATVPEAQQATIATPAEAPEAISQVQPESAEFLSSEAIAEQASAPNFTANLQGELADAGSNAALIEESVATGLTVEQVESLAASATQRWIDSGLSNEQVEALQQISYQLQDFSGNILGSAEGLVVSIDSDAAGSSWFIDQTPDEDEEFRANHSTLLLADSGSTASTGYDLLSVLLHEQAHVLGLPDVPGNGTDLMNGKLSEGVRRLPVVGQADGFIPGSLASENFLVGDQSFLKTLGGANNETVVADIQTDAAGNIYFAGTVSGLTGKDLLGNDISGLQGLNDVFVAKIDAQGNQIYFKTLGGSDNDSVINVRVDALGNLFVSGRVGGTSAKDFSGNDISGLQGDADVFVAKLDSSGNQSFFKTLGGNGEDTVSTIEFDASGNLFVTGTISGVAAKDFSGNDISGLQGGSADVFVAKIDTNGDQTFIKTLGGEGAETSKNTIKFDANGNVFVTGTISGTTAKDFLGNDLTGLQGGDDIFLAKLDPNGNQTFLKTFGGPFNGVVNVIQPDASGNILIAGLVASDAKDFAGNDILDQQGSYDGFVAKLDKDGKQVFFEMFGGPNGDGINSLQVDATGNVFVAGTINGTASKDFARNDVADLKGGTDVFAAKLDVDGKQTFFKTFGGTGREGVTTAQLDASGNLYLVGATLGTSVKDFEGKDISGLQRSNVYVAKLDANGNQSFLKTYGGAGRHRPVAALLDASGNIVITGTASPLKDFNGNDVATQGSLDVVVAKLDSNGNQVFFKTAGGSGADRPASVKLDTSGNPIVVGTLTGTSAKDFEGNDISGLQGSADVFVAKFEDTAPPANNNGGTNTNGEGAGEDAVATGVVVTVTIDETVSPTGTTITTVLGSAADGAGTEAGTVASVPQEITPVLGALNEFFVNLFAGSGGGSVSIDLNVTSLSITDISSSLQFDLTTQSGALIRGEITYLSVGGISQVNFALGDTDLTVDELVDQYLFPDFVEYS